MARPLQVEFQIEGLTKLRSEMRQLGIDSEDLKEAGKKAGKIVLREARRRAPVRTGALKNSLRVSATKRAVGMLGGKATVPYAAPIHWGWPAGSFTYAHRWTFRGNPSKGIAGNDFLSRAAWSTEMEWLPMYLKAVDEAIEKVKGVRDNG